jgi:hypothetical protein
VDEMLNDKKKQEEMIKKCFFADIDNGKSIILFASPQMISENKFWQKAIGHCIQHDNLHLICTNKVHFICSFGMSF